MSLWERWVFRAAFAASLLTGLLYGWVRFFGERLGEFGPEPHPWQSTLQHLHVLAVPTLVFGFGLLLRAHVLPSLRETKARRPSGLLLLGLMAPLVFSGYLRQTSVSPFWQGLWSWTHIISGCLFGLGGILHLLLRVPSAAARTSGSSPLTSPWIAAGRRGRNSGRSGPPACP